MSILDTINSKNSRRVCLIYALVSAFVLVFGLVYEIFSHGVISYYMVFAFTPSLLLGVLPFYLFSLSKFNYYPPCISSNLYHGAIASLTVGSIMRGVLDIYGTTSYLVKYYLIVGVTFIVLAVSFAIYKILLNKRKKI